MADAALARPRSLIRFAYSNHAHSGSAKLFLADARALNIYMNLLVTGGCGFIGSNFIRHILQQYSDYRVINFDKLTYAGNPANLKDVESYPRYGFVRGDICDPEVVELLVSRKPDVIVHFAAESHVDKSIQDADVFVKTNIYGTHVLLEAARRQKVERFVYISTDEVYGSRSDGHFKESDALNPSNPYAASKAAADLLVQAYAKTYGIPVVITRSSNNFWPYQYPEKLMGLAITNLIEDKKIPIYGDGKYMRDWLYVLDNCEAIDRVVHDGRDGEIYNIGGGNERTNLEIIEMILEEFAKDTSHIEYVKDRPAHDRRYALDTTKIREQLGWQPRRVFKEALRDKIAWYRNNEDWWKPIKSGEFLDYYKKQYQNVS